MAQAHWHHFTFRLGELRDIDRAQKTVALSPYLDEAGQEVTPVQSIAYDTLVVCIGSLSNDFGTPGVREHAMRLETAEDARRFHARMVNACIRAHHQAAALRSGQLHEIKSPLILQPGPAALTEGLDALHAICANWIRASITAGARP